MAIRFTSALVAIVAGVGLAMVPIQALAASGSPGVTATWSVARVPAPSGMPNLTGNATQLGCTSAAFCAMMPSPGYLTTLSNGVASTVVAPHSPDPYSIDNLASVACIHDGSCIAIGSTAEGPGDPLHVYRDVLHNGTWTATNGNSEAYQQIACGTQNCVAIGNVYDQGPFEARIDDRVTGGQWGTGTLTIPFPQRPRPPDVVLNSVSCPYVGKCVALGDADGKQKPLRPVLFNPRGDVWQGVAEVFPHGADPRVAAGTAGATGMSCVSSYNCIGLGQYRDKATGGAHLFVEILSKGVLSARALRLPNTTGDGVEVNAGQLDCASMTACAGTASWKGPGGSSHSVLVRLTGGVWSVHQAQRPAGAAAGAPVTVNGTACATTSKCIAVGSYRVRVNGHVRTRAAYWSWNTDRWVAHGIDSGLRAANQSLTGVECPSASKCIAVGGFDDRPVYATADLVSG